MSPDVSKMILKVTNVCEILNDSIAQLQIQIDSSAEEIVKLKERVDHLENKSPGFHDSYL